MSDNENKDNAPTSGSINESNSDIPTKKGTSKIPLSKDTSKIGLSKTTSAVPLMKETVRVTLKAADQKPAASTSQSPEVVGKKPDFTAVKPPVPPASARPAPTIPLTKTAAPAPTTPVANRPGSSPAAAPTVPLTSGMSSAPKPPTATSPAKPAAPAPTIQLKTKGAASAPTAGTKPAAPMPTIKLATTNAPVGAPAPTIPLKTASPSTPVVPTASAAKTQPGPLPVPGALPKATVQLPSPTQPLTSPTQPLTGAGGGGPSAQTFQIQSTTADGPPTITKVFACLGLAAAIGVLACQLKLSSIWIKAADNPNGNEWGQLFE